MRTRMTRWDAVAAALLAVTCSGCPPMAITMGAKTAAGILADDRSLEQQASDLHLTEQINGALVEESSDLAARVNVDVFLGRVMLTGVVGDDDDRWTASRVARRVAAEHEVYDDIEVAPSGGVSGEAESIATNKALGVNLLADEGLASQSLLHRVVNGTAFVMGEVREDDQIESVRSAALGTPGVRRVVTHIVLEQ